MKNNQENSGLREKVFRFENLTFADLQPGDSQRRNSNNIPNKWRRTHPTGLLLSGWAGKSSEDFFSFTFQAPSTLSSLSYLERSSKGWGWIPSLHPGLRTTWQDGRSLSDWGAVPLTQLWAALGLRRGLCWLRSCSPSTCQTSSTILSPVTSRNILTTRL